jgi:hypothetical protein
MLPEYTSFAEAQTKLLAKKDARVADLLSATAKCPEVDLDFSADMRAYYLAILAAAAPLLGGCNTYRVVPVTHLPDLSEPAPSVAAIPTLMPQSYTLVEEPLTLSPAHPLGQHGDCQFRLISIAGDGTTRIRLVQTGRELMPVQEAFSRALSLDCTVCSLSLLRDGLAQHP